MKLKIDKGIPIPQVRQRRNTVYRDQYQTIATWEVGDSVAFEYVKKTTGKEQRASYSPAAQALKRKATNAGQKIKQVTLPDEGVIRIWRVE